MVMRLTAAAGVTVGAAAGLIPACGTDEESSRSREKPATVTIYLLDGHLSPFGYRGRLVPIERPVSGKPDAQAAVQALFRGPTPDEQRHGLISPVGDAELLSLEVRDDRAIVDFAGAAPDSVDAGGQVLYTLTELPGISNVSLRLNGEPCCFWTHSNQVIDTVTRGTLRGWSGEPCHLRTTPTHVRCR
jgi:sporulation and spore germination protein